MTSRWSGKHLSRLPGYVLGGVIGFTAVVFIACWVAMDGGFQRAWEILLGLRSPYGQASGLGVVLSALGYIAVPTVIGIGVADGITRFIRRRLQTRDEAEKEIRELVQAALEKSQSTKSGS
jgi:predicted RND superfamily exporter protein